MNYLFGYGSIINDASRCSTLCGIKSESSSPVEMYCGGAGEWDRAIAVWLEGVATRNWCYRSTTGFTALGLQLNPASSHSTFGVLFPIAETESLTAFDVREKGYDRIELPVSVFTVDASLGSAAAQQRARDFLHSKDTTQLHIWTYIPSPAYTHEPDEEHPILQSYVDVVIRGCLQWGGRSLADRFLSSTFGWNAFYLNDTLLSRRPWLHRQDYVIIDEILQSAASSIQFYERKHPEEFAARHLTLLRGLWGVPARNSSFVGREKHLHRLEEMFQFDSACISRVEVQGIGGIGKTQLCIEFCYRHYSVTYGFIAWIRAETSASIAGDMRRLAFDLGVISADNKAEEESYEDAVVIEEVRRRLSRCQCRWLLIFDNASDPAIIESYLPRGQLGRSSSRSTSPTCARGHVLITSRVTTNTTRNIAQTLRLECFSPEESVGYFESVLEDHNIINPNQHHQMQCLGEKLGHLPLALAIAAAYMMRCDVSIEEYNMRLDRQEKNQHDLSFLEQSNGEISVMKSLSITLDRLCTVSATANKVLPLLAYVSPDHINKKLICALLRRMDSSGSSEMPKNGSINLTLVYAAIAGFIAAVAGSALLTVYSIKTSLLLCVFGAVCAHYAISAVYGKAKVFSNPPSNPTSPSQSSQHNDESVLAESDALWEIFVEFSLISVSGVRGAKMGSMHRLQQAVLRSRYKTDRYQHLQVCMLSLMSLWTFCAHDFSTWSACSNYFEHIQVLSGHIANAVPTSPSLFSVDVLIQFCYVISESALFSTIFLSRFGTAQGLLECAQSIIVKLKQEASKQHIRSLDIIYGCITHTLGKVARYRGSLKTAEKLLLSTLENWKTLQRESARLIPHTCHELGIVYLRMNETSRAEEYFSMALQLRKSHADHLQCNIEGVNIDRLEALISVHESATLYQMAVIATATKQYSRAEELLLEALSMEHSARSTSRAATLQQLGRVELRRGNKQLASSRLREALQIYCEIYGDQRAMSHVNVVAVRHQLGCVASAQKLHHHACTEYAFALKGRRMIYGDDCDHIEVALEMQALGQAQFDSGNVDDAFNTLKDARAMLYRLLQTDPALLRTHDNGLDYSGDSSSRRHHDCLMNSLLFILHRLRKIAKCKGLQREAQQYDCEIVQHKTNSSEPKCASSIGKNPSLSQRSRSTQQHKESDVFVPPELCRVVALRKDVRLIAKSLLNNVDGRESKHLAHLRSLLDLSNDSAANGLIKEYCKSIVLILEAGEDSRSIALGLFKCSDVLRDSIREEYDIKISDC